MQRTEKADHAGRGALRRQRPRQPQAARATSRLGATLRSMGALTSGAAPQFHHESVR